MCSFPADVANDVKLFPTNSPSCQERNIVEGSTLEKTKATVQPHVAEVFRTSRRRDAAESDDGGSYEDI